MEPFFSIVIPTFNRETLVVQAIESVLRQTFLNFEIIVVNDGSTDETESAVLAIADPRIRYYKKTNEERSIARNFGIARAKGRYVNFLDSDDVFYRHHLDTAHTLLRDNIFPEIGHLGYEKINESGIVLLRRNTFDDTIEEQMIHDNILHCNAVFLRRDIAMSYPFINERNAVISEDWYLWMRLVSRFKVYFDNTVTSAIVEHHERSLNTIDPDRLIASTALVVEHLQKDSVFMKKFNTRTNYFFSNQYTLVTLVLSLTKRRRFDTAVYLLKAVKFDLSVVFRRRFLASVKHFF